MKVASPLHLFVNLYTQLFNEHDNFKSFLQGILKNSMVINPRAQMGPLDLGLGYEVEPQGPLVGPFPEYKKKVEKLIGSSYPKMCN